MRRLKDGEVQVNIALPKELAEAVVEHQHVRRLKHQKEAFRELIEKGLAQAKEAPHK
jgi:hypothetical protein